MTREEIRLNRLLEHLDKQVQNLEAELRVPRPREEESRLLDLWRAFLYVRDRVSQILNSEEEPFYE